MPFCESCSFWLYVYNSPSEGPIGTCDHPVVEGKVTIETEEGEMIIHTAHNFGCIYHEINKVVAKIEV